MAEPEDLVPEELGPETEDRAERHASNLELFVDSMGEAVLRESVDRCRVARNMFSFGHFPIIDGIVLSAVAAKHVVAHPGHELATSDLVALGGSIAAFLGGFIGLQWQAARRVMPERVASILIVGIAAQS